MNNNLIYPPQSELARETHGSSLDATTAFQEEIGARFDSQSTHGSEHASSGHSDHLSLNLPAGHPTSHVDTSKSPSTGTATETDTATIDAPCWLVGEIREPSHGEVREYLEDLYPGVKPENMPLQCPRGTDCSGSTAKTPGGKLCKSYTSLVEHLWRCGPKTPCLMCDKELPLFNRNEHSERHRNGSGGLTMCATIVELGEAGDNNEHAVHGWLAHHNHLELIDHKQFGKKTGTLGDRLRELREVLEPQNATVDIVIMLHGINTVMEARRNVARALAAMAAAEYWRRRLRR